MQHLTQFANTSAISGMLSTIMTNKRSWSSKLTTPEQNMKKFYISRSCDSICSCGIMVCMYECKLFLMGFLHPKLGLRFFSRCGYVKKWDRIYRCYRARNIVQLIFQCGHPIVHCMCIFSNLL